ncbi:MAG TPA: energy transducer TonB, partial [Holophagaceae bacterium]|nr:energy transducer TonB [Holophagaceae bacterium]
PPPPSAPKVDVKPEVKDIVPDTPKELPKIDQSQEKPAAPAGVPGGQEGGVPGGVVGGTGKVLTFDFSQVKVRLMPTQPPYPPMAKMARIQGTVVVEVSVGPDGVPTAAHAVEGPPLLRQYAETWAMHWRFEPLMQNGQPQYGRFKINMNFRLN